MAHEPQGTPGTLSNSQLVAFLSALDGLGIDSARVLERGGVPPERYADPAGRIPAGLFFGLWGAAREVSGDPAIGLRVGQRMSFDALGGFGYLLTHSLTLRELIEHAAKFVRLADDHTRIELHERGELACVRVQRAGGYPVEGIDSLFVSIAQVSRRLFPQHMPSRRACARLAHAGSVDVATYEAYLGCRVELNAAHYEVEGPAEWLEERISEADPKLGQVLHEHAKLLLEKLPPPDPFLQSVREQLTARLSQGDVGLATLARALHLSERTLRRRLADQGTSYQTLLDELRAKVACKLIEQDGQPVDVIAQQVGFSDTSSFFHAFKRWTGKTP
ncbi:MAG TPA: AraC family transcriptional regulator, partial [Polyangiales bacterium]|nr:AraC family transcriptional regulator [Polyangiales bacterium]